MARLVVVVVVAVVVVFVVVVVVAAAATAEIMVPGSCGGWRGGACGTCGSEVVS